ncbi:very long chain fatty acid elongase F-like [Eurosta solidaginis]|uniref:very long chain fatty acid elongase F-like n=1 Tax=Eurosta solidaginis TaxID=178769 RepID=UPI003531421D
MFLVLRLLYKEIRKLDSSFNRDLRLSTWPLLGAPWPMFTILAVYLFVIKKWGPKLMENQKPLNVKSAMQIYNLIQVALNAYIFTASLRNSYLKPYFHLSCQPYDPKDDSPEMMALAMPAYLYYVSKYMDLIDTIFFLLRKKYRQISFLHVYHHTIMVYGVWNYCTLNYASHFTFTGIINSFVHVCMYSYYFLATKIPNEQIAPWKRRLTLLQIVQFCTLTLQLSLPIVNNWCGLDLFWVWVAFLQNFFILILFCDFYYKTYLYKSKTKVVQKKKLEQQHRKKMERPCQAFALSASALGSSE